MNIFMERDFTNTNPISDRGLAIVQSRLDRITQNIFTSRIENPGSFYTKMDITYGAAAGNPNRQAQINYGIDNMIELMRCTCPLPFTMPLITLFMERVSRLFVMLGEDIFVNARDTERRYRLHRAMIDGTYLDKYFIKALGENVLAERFFYNRDMKEAHINQTFFLLTQMYRGGNFDLEDEIARQTENQREVVVRHIFEKSPSRTTLINIIQDFQRKNFFNGTVFNDRAVINRYNATGNYNQEALTYIRDSIQNNIQRNLRSFRDSHLKLALTGLFQDNEQLSEMFNDKYFEPRLFRHLAGYIEPLNDPRASPVLSYEEDDDEMVDEEPINEMVDENDEDDDEDEHRIRVEDLFPLGR
jgi:hypothetical protein